MHIRQAIANAITKEQASGNRPDLGRFWLYDADGNFLIGTAASRSFLMELAKTAEAKDAVLFIPTPFGSQPASSITREDAVKAGAYLVVGKRAWQICRDTRPEYDQDLLDISPEVAGTMLELAAL